MNMVNSGPTNALAVHIAKLSCNGLVLSDNEPLWEPMLTKVYGIMGHLNTMCYKKITAKTRYINEAFNLDLLEIKRTSNMMIKKAIGTNIILH